jgi:hypothetical protein
MLKKLLLASSAILALSGSAFAADLSRRTVIAPAPAPGATHEILSLRLGL